MDKDIFSTEDPTLTAGSKAEHDAAALWPSCWSRLRAVIVGSSGPLPQLTADADSHTYVSDYEASMAQLKQERGGGGEGEEAEVVTDADVDAEYYEDDSSSDHEADEDEEEDDFDMSQFEFFGMSSRGLCSFTHIFFVSPCLWYSLYSQYSCTLVNLSLRPSFITFISESMAVR